MFNMLCICLMYFKPMAWQTWIWQFAVTDLFCMCLPGNQGSDGAPSQDFMSASGSNQRQEPVVQFPYCQKHPLLQFLPIKLAEWVAKNLADELHLPVQTTQTKLADSSRPAVPEPISYSCLVSDCPGENMHTFQTIEFESDLYLGVIRAWRYPFDMAQRRFHGNVKVCLLRLHWH